MTVFAAFLPSSLASARDRSNAMALVPIVINHVDKGVAAAIIEGADVLVAVSDLDEGGLADFAGTRRTVDGKNYVSLASLAPGVTFRLDPKDLSLSLQADPALLSGHESLNLRSGRPAGIFFASNPSGFLNYATTLTNSGAWSGFAESGWSMKGNLLYSSLSRKADGAFVRGLTNYTIDDRPRMVRWVAGDALATGGPLGGGLFLSGISVSKNFGLDPYFYRFPSMGVSGAVSTPTRADVYVNGTLVQQVQLAPGSFELKDIGLQTGLGDTRVVLRDAFGQERVISNPYYLSSNLLARGLSEYSYNLGLRREEMSTESFQYGGPVLVAFHRLGLSDRVTAGLNVEAAKGVTNGGGTFDASLGFGQVDVSAAASQGNGTSGWAYSAALTTIARGFNVGGFWRARSDAYSTVTLAATADRPIQELGGTVAVSLGRLGTIGAQFARQRFRDTGDRSSYALTLGSPVARNLSILATVGRKRGIDGWSGIDGSLRVSYYLGGLATASVAASHDDGGTQAFFDAHKSTGSGTGYGYRVRGQTSGSTTQLTALAEYQGTLGHYEAQYSRFGNSGSGFVTASGGIVAIGGTVMASRAVQNGFALLRVPGIEGLTGSVSNQPVGKTNRKGDLLLPELLPYYGNVVDVGQSELPVDVDLVSSRKIVAPPYRGGAIVEFAAQKIQAFRGSVTLSFRGGDVVPALGSITITAGGKSFETSISRRGEYYLENVPPGVQSAEIVYMGIVCRTPITFPRTTDSMSRLGEVVCAVDGPVPGGLATPKVPPPAPRMQTARGVSKPS